MGKEAGIGEAIPRALRPAGDKLLEAETWRHLLEIVFHRFAILVTPTWASFGSGTNPTSRAKAIRFLVAAQGLGFEEE